MKIDDHGSSIDDQGSSAADGLARIPAESRPRAYAAGVATTRTSVLDLWESEYNRVVRFVMRAGADVHAAEDATQWAFVEAWKLAMRPDEWEKIHNPKAWIRTVALRKYRRPPGRRRQPLTVAVAEVPEWEISRDDADLTNQSMFVLAELRRLDKDTRTVMAFHIDGFTSAEIARQLKTTDQKVRDLLKKGRKVLARRLSPLREHGDGMEMGTR
jgi:RNA polymerase sigma factor (sigma-70 family)